MPSSIPFDPSLVLGNVVHDDVLSNLNAVSNHQADIDAAEDTLNSSLELKHSMAMTINELENMEVGNDATTKIKNELVKIEDSVKKNAVAYAEEKMVKMGLIQDLKKKIRLTHKEFESPVDYNKTGIKSMPIASDSLKMNVQYFAANVNSEKSETHAAKIKSYLGAELSHLGSSRVLEITSAAQKQTNSQQAIHTLAGTLVISISCTHKSAKLLAPFILDVDKAIRVWNNLYTKDRIIPDNLQEVEKIAKEEKLVPSLNILSGATYGSCFVGMVHIVDTTTTVSSQEMYSFANKVQAQFAVGGWFAKESGGFGVDSNFAGDIKSLLSTQNVASHCTLVTMGVIPSVKANSVKMAVKSILKDGEGPMDKLATLMNAVGDDKQTVDSAAAAARAGKQMLAMQNSKVEGVLASLSKIDSGENKVLDINSLMNAMDDYISKITADNADVGVPINYYVKPITKSQLAQMWVSKYFPGKYMMIKNDDGVTAELPPNDKPKEQVPPAN